MFEGQILAPIIPVIHMAIFFIVNHMVTFPYPFNIK